MAVAVGVDVAKDFHGAAVELVDTGKLLLSKRVDNDPDSIGELVTYLLQVQAEHGPVTVAIDLMGGVASLLTTMLLEAGVRLVHVPGLVVNRARRATRGGEHKSDPRDAKVIADQLRLHDDWRELDFTDDISLDLRLLAGRRRGLVVEQTRRLVRLRELLASIFPGLERNLEVTNLADLILLDRYATPAEIRRAGNRRVTEYLLRQGVRRPYAEKLATVALTAATQQRITVPGEARIAEFVRELASEAMTAKRRITELNGQIAADLDRHPDAALVLSLPGMGATLAGEFLAEVGNLARFQTADQLASAAGLAPVLQQSGKTNYLRRATAGSKTLKFVFYQSAFCAIKSDPASKAFYRRKRAEGKRHHQALIALARRRINVLHAMLRSRQPYRVDYIPAAAA